MIYLDNAATSPVFPEVVEAIQPYFTPEWVGNASSIHSQGARLHRDIETARERVAALINADPSEIYFTSGGTESNNAWLKCFDGDLVLTTTVEHESVLGPLEHGAARYPQRAMRFIKVDSDGRVDLHDLERVLKSTRHTGIALSVMWVNNELGTVNPIYEIGEMCRERHVFFHTDAVQAVGHWPVDVKECHVDALSMSGHKFGAPPGVGALYISHRVHKHPLIIGGGQENGMRGGTCNTPGIVGMGVAAYVVKNLLRYQTMEWENLCAYFLDCLCDEKIDYQINGAYCLESCSNILSLTFPGVNAESLLLLLDQKGIYLSAGSACSAASSKPSHVLKGIGMSDEDAASTIRLSMGYETTKEELAEAAHAIAECIDRLKAMYP